MINIVAFPTNALFGLAHPSAGQANGKIRTAAQQFEAVLLSNIFQGLQNSVSSFSDEGGDSSSKTFNELGIQQLAIAAADSGGIGISPIITKYLEHQSAPNISESSSLKLFREMPIYELQRKDSEVLSK